MRLFSRIMLLGLLTASLCAQSKLNPATQVNWPLATGSGFPSSIACTSSNFGQPYTDTAYSLHYTCRPIGWVADMPLSGGTFTGPVYIGSGSSLTPTGSGTILATGLTGNPSLSLTNLAVSGTVTFPGIEPTSGTSCLQIDISGHVTTTNSACGSGGGGGGSGTVGSGSVGQFAVYTGTNTVGGSAHWSDVSGWLTGTEGISLADGSGTGGYGAAGFGTPPTASASNCTLWASSATSQWMKNCANTGGQVIPGVATAGTVGHIWTVASDHYGMIDGGPVPTGGSSLLAASGVTGQTANISQTTVYTTTAAGRYMICIEGAISTAAGTSSTFPNLIAVWTSSYDSAVKNQIMGIGGQSSNNGTYQGETACTVVNATSGSVIGYKTSNYASSGSPQMAYYLYEYVYSVN